MTDQPTRTPRPRGRKPLPPSEVRVLLRCYVTRASLERLEALRIDGEPLGLTVDRVLAAQKEER